MPAQSLKAEIAAAKEREAEVRSVFQKYDTDNSDTIEMAELMALLDDLGLLAKLKTSTVEFAARMFNEFDTDDNGVLTFEEFKNVYNAAKDDAAGKPRKPFNSGIAPGARTADDLDSNTQAARKHLAFESAMRKAEEAEQRRKENAEMKAKLAAKGGGDSKQLDETMQQKRKELAEAKRKKKEEEAARIAAQNKAMRDKLKNTKAATDNDITDDVGADGTVGAGRNEAAAASKARKDAEAARLAAENAAMRQRIASTGAATDNDITDDVWADGTVGAGRNEAAAASKARKDAEAARLAAENAALRKRLGNTGAATDNDVTDDAAGFGRIEAAAASKARKDADAARLAAENEALRKRLASTGAATSNKL